MLNTKKTERMIMNEDPIHPSITSINGSHIKEVKDFKYLGSHVAVSALGLFFPFYFKKRILFCHCVAFQLAPLSFLGKCRVASQVKTVFHMVLIR